MTMVATDMDTIHISGKMVIVPEEEYEDLIKAKENDEYRKKLERSFEQAERGETISFTMDELKAMEDEEWKPTQKVLDWMQRMEDSHE